MTDEEFMAWPKCAVPACQNKCCLRLRSKYCWPHTPGTPQEAADNLRDTEPLEESAPVRKSVFDQLAINYRKPLI